MYKARLLKRVKRISEEKVFQIKALKHVSDFIQAASNEAAYGDSISLFGHLKSAGKLLSSDFEYIDKNITDLKSSDRRVVPFLRSQLFIALIASLEDYLSLIMKEILLSFPEKIITKTIEKNQIFDSNNQLHLIEKLADKMIMDTLYKSPREYRMEFEKVISADRNLLEPYWDSYVEMKATRDTGMHSGWKVNRTYIHKAGENARNKTEGTFLPITKDYFEKALQLGEQIINSILNHISNKYKGCTYSFVFKEMWNNSSLSRVVQFEEAWKIESDYMVRPKKDFSWGWSHSELMMFEFFYSIYSGEEEMPPLTKLFRRLNENDIKIINTWLYAPFFFGSI